LLTINLIINKKDMNFLKRNKIYAAIVGSFMVLSVLSVSIPVLARFSATDDMVVTQAEAFDAVAAHLTLNNQSEATSTVLVDLSDNTNFFHVPSSGSIDISEIIFSAYSISENASGTAKFGVIASSTNEGALVDVYWFKTVYFDTDISKSDSWGKEIDVKYSPSVLQTRIESGSPTKFLTDDTSLLTSDYATTTDNISPNGNINPNVGDLVMDIPYLIGNATITVDILYSVKE